MGGAFVHGRLHLEGVGCMIRITKGASTTLPRTPDKGRRLSQSMYLSKISQWSVLSFITLHLPSLPYIQLTPTRHTRPHNTRIPITGTHIRAIQLLVFRPRRTARVLIKPKKLLLPRITARQLIIPPLSPVVQPRRRRAPGINPVVRRAETRIAGVAGGGARRERHRVEVRALDRIPQVAVVVRGVLDEAIRQRQVRDRVIVRPGGGVVGVGAVGGVRHQAVALFGEAGGVPVEGLAVGVLAVPGGRGRAVDEADHVVFPVADVVAKFLREHDVAAVVRVEVHVEGVDSAILVVVDDDGARDGVLRGAAAVRGYA